MKRAAVAATLVALALSPAAAAAAGTGGVADSSFGAAGLATVSTAVAGSRESGNAMVLDGQNRVLVGGGATGSPSATGEGGWVLARFRSDGSLDTGFGDGGVAKAPGLYGPGLSQFGQAIRALAIEPGTGKIIAGGMTVDATHFGEYTVARYNTDGSLDMSFGPADTGFVKASPSTSSDELEALTVSTDGSITAVGAAGLGAGLVRWSSDGVLDPGFDGPGVPGNGMFVDQPTTGFDTYRSVQVEADGSVRAVGVATTGGESNWLIARYLPSGARDGAFNGSGYVVTDFGGGSDLGGDQILLGNTLYAFGSIDTEPGKDTERDFGADAFNATTGAEIPGTRSLAPLPGNQNLLGAGLQRLGGSGDASAQRFLLVGTGEYGGGGGSLLMRMRRAGGDSTALELDPEFGSAGIVPPPRTSGVWDDVATDGQGRVVVGGDLGIYETADLAAARFVDLAAVAVPKDVVAPVLSKVSVTPRTWAVKPRGKSEVPLLRAARQGTSFRYSLSEAARVRFMIERRRPRGHKRKARFKSLASFAQAGAAGPNRKPFGGRIGKQSLKPGRYRATLVATDAAGNSSAPRRVSFKVVRP